LGLLPGVLLPHARLQTVRRDDYSDPFLTELYAMAVTLAEESWDAFRQHAMTNELVHVFRDRATGAVVGFQFWRSAPMTLRNSRVIRGGKLRVLPSHRGQGLHLLSGLLFYLHCKARHPTTRFYRMSVATLFGFVSIAQALAWYRFFDPDDASAEGRALAQNFADFADASGFRVEPSGLIFTGIGLPDATLAQFGPAYFERATARAYLARNPAFRTNRCFVGFWFRFDARNFWSMARTVGRKLRA
jgi:GNAT superfamily N-acetyltransferase